MLFGTKRPLDVAPRRKPPNEPAPKRFGDTSEVPLQPAKPISYITFRREPGTKPNDVSLPKTHLLAV